MSKNKICSKPACEELKYSTSTYCRPHHLEWLKENNPKHPERSGSTHSSYYKKFPAPQKGIYGLIDPDKNVVYIGESKYISSRVYTHLSINKGALEDHLEDLTGYNYIILWDGSEDTKSNRLAIEAMLIHALKPKYNKQWNQED